MAARRVLIVDDDNGVREVARVSLELLAGWQVLDAASGADGISVAAAQQPDAILLDVMMPDMDGPATVESLQSQPATRDIPVIMLTAVAQDHHLRRFEELGVAGFIPKPFDALQLARQIAQTLGWDC